MKGILTKIVSVLLVSVFAASVFTGCSMGVVPPVTEDETTGFQTLSDTASVNDEDLIVEVSGYSYDNDSKILSVNIKATNFSNEAVTLTTTPTGVYASAEAYVDAVTELNSQPLSIVAPNDNQMNIWNKTVPAKVGSSAGVITGNLYFYVDSSYKDWSAVTLVISVASEIDDDTDEPVAEVTDGDLRFVIVR